MLKDTDMESKDEEDPKLVGTMILLHLRWHPRPHCYYADANEHTHRGPGILRIPRIWTPEGK